MVAKIDLATRSRIKALLPVFSSNKELLENLQKSGKGVSLSSVERIRREEKQKSTGWTKPPKKLPAHMRPNSKKKRDVKAVDKLISSPNPPSQRMIAKKLGRSRRYIQRILKDDLQASQVKKRKVHALTANQAKQRYVRGKKFIKYLSRRKLKFIFTMDEAMVPSNEIRGVTKFYYKKEGVVVPDAWKKLPRTNWPKNVMVAMGICWMGKSRIYVVPEETTINADNFIKLILKPMFEKDIPRLYGKDAKKVTFHMDSAPAHVAAKTGQWLVDHKFSYIPKQDWLSNSPDLAPMDYAINYVFKKFLNAKVVKSRAQLVRSIRTAWSKVQITVIRRALLSWKRRVGMMLEKFGYQYEQEL